MNSHKKNHSRSFDNRVRRISWMGTLSVTLALAVTSSRAATLTVTNTNDSGAGSLRGAIAAATNGDTITFSLPLPSSITLSSGALTVTQNVTITGPGRASLAIDGNATSNVFAVVSNATITGLTVTNGSSLSGGGIFDSAASLTLSNVTVTGNSGGGGGGIFCQGLALSLVNCSVVGNTTGTNGEGGGIACWISATQTVRIVNTTISGNQAGTGGGIYLAALAGPSGYKAVDLVLSMTGTTVSGNVAADYGGGMYVFAPGSYFVPAFSGVVFSNNAAGIGGGICADYRLTLSMNNFSLIGNVASGLGGGLCNIGGFTSIGNARLLGNSAGLGGAIGNSVTEPFGNGVSLIVMNSMIISNSASSGGAIWQDTDTYNASAQIFSSTLAYNQATNIGGAIYNYTDGGNGSVEIVGSTFSNNVAAAGGAIYNFGEPLVNWFGNATVGITNSTFSGNSAETGGAIYNLASIFITQPPGSSATVQIFGSTFDSNIASSIAGGIYNQGIGATGSVSIVSSTFYGNSATIGGGVYNLASPAYGHNGGSLLDVTNSTFSGNTAGTGGAVYNLASVPPPPTNGSASAAVQMFNSTFADNSGTNGGGILYNTNYGVGSASVQVGSSILDAGVLGGTILNSAGTIKSSGFNLSSDNAGGALTNSTDVINTDPQLGPLQYNGGAAMTHALLLSSPAIDKGKNFAASAYDERGPGYTRTYDYPSVPNAVGGDGTDIGAFELQTFFDPFAIWQFQNFGCTNCPQAAPTADPDGDGADNMAEYLAGTNPNNPSSALRVLAVTRQGNDLLVKWQTAGGHTNVLQSSGTLATGGFSDISSNIVIPGTGDATNSYLEAGGALNGTNSFYRVRLGP